MRKYLFNQPRFAAVNCLLGLILFMQQVGASSILGVVNPAVAVGGNGASAYVAAHYFMGNDYVALKDYSGDWSGDYSPRSGKNLAMAIGRAEVGISCGTWRIATLYRREILIESNRDTTDMAYYNKRRLSVPAERSFVVDLRGEGFEADGIRLDKGFVFTPAKDTSLSVGAGVSLLRGKQVRIGRVNGTASSTPTGYTYSATLEDSNSQATYPFIRDAHPTGQGYALDVGTKIGWANGTRLELAANDLLGEMRWENMPHTFAVANSNTITRDESGYINFNPAVTGTNDVNRRKITQKLDPKFHGQFFYPIANFDVSAGTDWFRDYWFLQTGVAYRLNASWKMALDYDVRFKTLGLGIKHQWFYLDFRSENASLDKAKAHAIAGGANVSF